MSYPVLDVAEYGNFITKNIFIETIHGATTASGTTNPPADVIMMAYLTNMTKDVTMRLTLRNNIPRLMFSVHGFPSGPTQVQISGVRDPIFDDDATSKTYVDTTISKEVATPPKEIGDTTYSLSKEDIYPILTLNSTNDQTINISNFNTVVVGRPIRIIKIQDSSGILYIQADTGVNLLFSGKLRLNGRVKIPNTEAGSIITLVKLSDSLWAISGPVTEDI